MSGSGSESKEGMSGAQSQGLAEGSEEHRRDDMEDLQHARLLRLSNARSVAVEALQTADINQAVQVVMCFSEPAYRQHKKRRAGWLTRIPRHRLPKFGQGDTAYGQISIQGTELCGRKARRWSK
jgi:hypothetical protein